MTEARRYKTAQALRTALEARLQEMARSRGTDIQRLRRRVAFDRFLARLFTVEPPQRYPWFLKGGYAMELRMRHARATKDIDLTLAGGGKAAGGLLPGLTVPVLTGLERKGLVQRGPREGRGKRRYSLTAKGERLLLDEGGHLPDIPTSSESVQRRLWVALATGTASSEGMEYLKAAWWDRTEAKTKRPVVPVHGTAPRNPRGKNPQAKGLTWSALLQQTAGGLRQPKQDPLRAWLRIRAVCESHRLEAEARAFQQLRDELGGDSTGGTNDERDKIESQ